MFDGTIISNVTEPEGRARLRGTLGYEMKAVETGVSLHGGSVGQPGVGSSTGD